VHFGIQGKVLPTSYRRLTNLRFLYKVKTPDKNFKKIRPQTAEMFHAGGRQT
jgi:hypothetical protein